MVETPINAPCVLAGGESLAEKAIRHTQQDSRRDFDKRVGRGECQLRVTATPRLNVADQARLEAAIDAFTTAHGRGKS